MNIEATIELNEYRLVWPQSAVCRATLRNGDSEDIEAVNRRNRNAAPAIVCRNVETGDVTVGADVLQTDFECPPTSIRAGEELVAEFPLSRVLRFPSCGVFEISARWETALGAIDSEPALVEVVPAIPEKLATVTRRGSLSGDVLAIWVNEDPAERSVWMTTIATGREGTLDASERVCAADVPAGIFLSVPANTIPTSRYAAWIDGSLLRFVRDPGEEPASLEIGPADFEIVPPIFEDPWDGGKPQFAEALLVEKGIDAWRVRIAVLSGQPILSRPREFKGAPPEWIASVYRSGGERFTFFANGTDAGETATVRLGVFSTKLRSIPGEPVFPAEWNGRMLAADVALTDDDRVVGAFLVRRDAGEDTDFAIHKWHLDRANELSQSTLPLQWNPKWPIARVIVRVNDNGTAYGLINGGPDNRWYWADGNGEISPLASISDRMSFPADIVFMGAVEPAILFTEKGCGLRLHYLGTPRVDRPRG